VRECGDFSDNLSHFSVDGLLWRAETGTGRADRQSIGCVSDTDAGRTDTSGLRNCVGSADGGFLFAGNRIGGLGLRGWVIGSFCVPVCDWLEFAAPEVVFPLAAPVLPVLAEPDPAPPDPAPWAIADKEVPVMEAIRTTANLYACMIVTPGCDTTNTKHGREDCSVRLSVRHPQWPPKVPQESVFLARACKPSRKISHSEIKAKRCIQRL
jgi:hypothetical protein